MSFGGFGKTHLGNFRIGNDGRFRPAVERAVKAANEATGRSVVIGDVVAGAYGSKQPKENVGLHISEPDLDWAAWWDVFNREANH